MVCHRRSVDNQWDKGFIILIVAGHTILHELTHLDTLGNQAGLDAPTDGNDMGRHGTDDAQKGAALPGARDHLAKYKADDSNASPDYNAESYAAAATGKTSVSPCTCGILKAHRFCRGLLYGALWF